MHINIHTTLTTPKYFSKHVFFLNLYFEISVLSKTYKTEHFQ